MKMKQVIIHVDMDAFYASVEMRDNPNLRGKPLIIGSLPQERGVVATCSYEARKYGIHSAMNIKEAYRLCPHGIYKRPNMEKYRAVSEQLRAIWKSYTPIVETVALDEAYLDITNEVKTLNDARRIAKSIKQRIRKELGLNCSVGLSYSKMAAKAASEENKPNGYFEILRPEDYVNLVIDRDVRVLHTVGNKTAQKLYNNGIRTVKDVQNNQELITQLFGKQGHQITKFAYGYDDRKVIPYRPQDAKSISREVTFQVDVTNYDLLKDILLLLALCVENKAKRYGLFGNGVTLKITYNNMKSITRSSQIFTSNSAITIWEEAISLLDKIEQNPVRLIGVGIHSLTEEEQRQISIADLIKANDDEKTEINKLLKNLQLRYGLNFSENINKIFQANILHKTVEYMRKHYQ